MKLSILTLCFYLVSKFLIGDCIIDLEFLYDFINGMLIIGFNLDS